MNKEHVRFHLQEASEAIQSILAELKDDSEYGEGDYWPDIQHLYYHINTAWNGRDATDEQVKICSEADFEKWAAFPADILTFS